MKAWLVLLWGVLAIVAVTTSVLVGSLQHSGPARSMFCGLPTFVIGDKLCPAPIIKGTVKPGFEPTRQAFQKNFDEGLEGGAQLAIYLKSEKVVDIWGKNPALTPAYSRISLQRVFSSSKMVESLVALICVEHELFKFNDPISRYWPEFAQNGKGKITVSDLLRSDAGLFQLSQPITREILEAYTKGEPQALSRIIEASTPEWPEHTRRVYHGVSRGWVLAELVRRVDHRHRLIHDFVREEISDQLGIDLFLMVPKHDDRFHNVAPLAPAPTSWMLLNVLLPYYLGTVPFVPTLEDDVQTMLRLSFSGDESYLARSTASLKVDGVNVADVTSWNKLYNISLGSSFGGIASGHALAVVASVFANRGSFAPNDVRLFSESTWREGSECSEEVFDAALGRNTSFSRAGFSCNFYGKGWYGWGGWGGSLLVWKEPEGVAMGYAMNRMGYHLWRDPRNLRFFEAVDESLKQQGL